MSLGRPGGRYSLIFDVKTTSSWTNVFMWIQAKYDIAQGQKSFKKLLVFACFLYVDCSLRTPRSNQKDHKNMSWDKRCRHDDFWIDFWTSKIALGGLLEAFRRRLGGILGGLEVSWMRLGSVLKAKACFLGSVARPGRVTCRKCDRGLFFWRSGSWGNTVWWRRMDLFGPYLETKHSGCYQDL